MNEGAGEPENDLHYFRAEIPIRHKNIEIGHVLLEFRASDSFPAELEGASGNLPSSQDGSAILVAVAKLFGYLEEAIVKDIQIALGHESRARTDRTPSELVYFFYYPKSNTKVAPKPGIEPFSYEREPYLIPDEEILTLVRTDGPFALRQGDVQYALTAWLGNKEIASEKMTKLKDALLESALGSSAKVSFKVGRPKIKASQTSGNDWIKETYREVTRVLKIAKQEAVPLKAQVARYTTVQLGKLIDRAYSEYVSGLKRELETAPESDKAARTKERVSRLSGLTGKYPMKISPIAALIRSDKDVEAEFRNLRFEPNKLSKVIVSKLLGMSISKLEKTLY